MSMQPEVVKTVKANKKLKTNKETNKHNNNRRTGERMSMEKFEKIDIFLVLLKVMCTCTGKICEGNKFLSLSDF